MMQMGSDAEFSWLQKTYVEHVRPRVLGNLDATSYSPNVAPTGTIVTGVEGANLGAAARRVAAAVEQAGGRPVVIDAVELRGMHDRLAPGGSRMLPTTSQCGQTSWSRTHRVGVLIRSSR
jgi:hypothetical protein